jgi:hypothetical protein
VPTAWKIAHFFGFHVFSDSRRSVDISETVIPLESPKTGLGPVSIVVPVVMKKPLFYGCIVSGEKTFAEHPFPLLFLSANSANIAIERTF